MKYSEGLPNTIAVEVAEPVLGDLPKELNHSEQEQVVVPNAPIIDTSSRLDEVRKGLGLPSSEQGSKTEKLGIKLNQYLQTRFTERGYSDDQREKMETVAVEIIDQYGIDQVFFDNPRHPEPFFAFCDSWNKNESDKSSGDYEKQKIFLGEFIRTLSGNYSKFNRDQFSAGTKDAGDFFEDPSSTAGKKQAKLFENIKNKTNLEKTQELEQMLRDVGDASVLKKCREKLGLNGNDKELPFDVVVIDASQKLVNNDDGLSSEWEEVTKSNGSSFVTESLDKSHKVIVVSTEMFENLKNGTHESKEDALEIIKHEYVHTQSRYQFGANRELGLFFEENIAIRASEGRNNTHMDAMALMLYMDILTENEQKPLLLDRFRQSFQSEEGSTEFMKYVSDKFGTEGLVALLALKPRAYVGQDSIKSIPGIDMDNKKIRTGSLFNIIMSSRAKISPTSLESFNKFFKELDGRGAEYFDTVRQWSGVDLPPEIVAVLNEKLQKFEGRVKY